jgi:hypothetical protein
MAQAATADSPHIVISYHASEDYWADRLIAELSRTEGKYGVLIDRVDGDTNWQPRELSLVAMMTARVLVLLLSPRYINSTLFASKSDYRDLFEAKADDVYSIKVREPTLEQRVALLPRFLPFNVTPLVDVTSETVQSVLSQAVTLITSRIQNGLVRPAHPLTAEPPTIADLSRLPRSNEVKAALRRARKLATLGPITPSTVTTPALLFGLAEGGRHASGSYFGTPQFLWKDLTGRDESGYTEALLSEFPGLTRLGEKAGRDIDSLSAETDRVSPNVVRVFELAEDIARRTVRYDSRQSSAAQQFIAADEPELEARHLLAALLFTPDSSKTGAGQRLAAITDLSALRRRFYNFIVKNVPLDDHEAWWPILINLKLPEIQPKQQDAPTHKPRESALQPSVPGFTADEWDGNDLLGITRDVNALASLVAAYAVEPPLSIGLFGDWGSGKSHFMRQMRKQVEKLSELARASNKLQNELGYYKNIVQIEFNAWHYIEGNLWASLVDHIFANLKLSEREPPKYAEQRRDELMQKLGLKEELKKKIDSQVEEFETELRKVQERKQQAEAELTKASTQLEDFRHQAVASLETLSVAVAFSAEEKELLGRLGIRADGVINGAEVRKNYDQLKGIRNRIKAQWKLFRTDKRVGRRYLLSALLVSIVVGGPLLLKLAPSFRNQTALITVLGFVATFIAAAKPAWDQFRKSLQALEMQDQEIERQRLQRITELESKVNALTGEVVTAKLTSETVGKEIEELKAEIDSTSSSKLLADFIEDRAAANDYRRHLGLLALIRRDFEKLRDLFNQQREEEIAGTEATNKNTINRIVLYIDDLDRCPPDRVVQVLQAIHLLLAFPLFVVVVGVDSRWITRSLQQSYEWLGEEDDLTNTDGQPANQGENRYGGMGATPHDYLEKIFQIPFWLRSMNDDVCVEFIDGLTKQSVYREPRTSEMLGLTPTEGVVLGGEPTITYRVNPPVPATVTPAPRIGSRQDPVGPGKINEPDQKPDQTPDLTPRSLTFTDKEIEYMKKLVPLIGRSPRAVKRFLNCYRLIKVGLTPAEFENFVGEQGESESYKAAMILLGMITGTPTASPYFLEELKNCPPNVGPRSLDRMLEKLEKNAELQQQPDAQRLWNFFKQHDFGKPADKLYNELYNFGQRCSRFSFKVGRATQSKQ